MHSSHRYLHHTNRFRIEEIVETRTEDAFGLLAVSYDVAKAELTIVSGPEHVDIESLGWRSVDRFIVLCSFRRLRGHGGFVTSRAFLARGFCRLFCRQNGDFIRSEN